jgi:hypothetical protein
MRAIAMLSDASSGHYRDRAGAMRRLFIIWNRGYKTQHVIAVDVEEALAISQRSGHTRKGYRRFRDITEGAMGAEEGIVGPPDGMIERALAYGKSGVAKLDVDAGWTIDGEPTWKPEDEIRE